jgi:Flp pilus assembly protein CpaB
MKTRGTALGLALALAIGATTAVFLYVQGVRQQAQTSPADDMQNVLVAKQDIPPGSNLDALIAKGVFSTVEIPRAALVQGVVTDLTQIKGRTTSAAILQGEQITTARLQGTTERTGGLLGIRDGYEALSISLESSEAGGGFIRAGDHVTIYATLENVSIIKGGLASFLKGKSPADNQKQNIGDYTVTVVPDVRVLRVLGGSAGSSDRNSEIQLSVELTPADSQRVIFAREKGSVWLTLLPPGQQGTGSLPTGVIDLLAPVRT